MGTTGTRARRPSALRGRGGRTRKSAETRERIMEAASRIMVERGAADFQMSEVSERCGLSKGSLYYYFSDRDELVRAVVDHAVDDLVDEVEGIVASAPGAVESIVGLARALADSVRPGGPLVLALARGASDAGAGRVEESRLERVVSILTAQFERAKGEGLMRPEVSSRLCAAAVAGAFLVFEHVAPEDLGARGEDLVYRIVDLAFCGMGTERGRALLAAGAPREDAEDPGKEA